MKNMKIATRLALIVLSFMLPLSVAVYLYYDNVTAQINFAKQEGLGSKYLRPVVHVLHGVQEHYTLKIRANDGDKDAEVKMAAVTANINKAFEEYKMVDAEIGADLQFDAANLSSRQKESLSVAEVEKKWQSIANADAGSTTTGQYDALIADLGGVIGYAGQYSNLILDPDLDSYSVMDAMIIPVPAAFGRIGNSERMVFAHLKSGAALASVDAGTIGSFATMLEQDDMGRTTADMQLAYSEDANFYGESPTLKSSTEQKLNEFNKEAGAYAASLHGLVKGDALAAAALFDQAQKAREASIALFDAGMDEMDVLFEKRIDFFASDRISKLSMFAGVLIAVFALCWYIASGLKNSMKKLQTAMVEIADGKLDYPVPCLDLKDEVGSMAKTLQMFKELSIEARKTEQEQQKEQQLKLERQQRVERLVDNFEQAVSGLLSEVSRSAETMQGTVVGMENAAVKTADKSNATIAVTKETSNNVAAVASAAEELSAAINEISSQVSRSATVSQEAVAKVQSADQTVAQLSNAAQQIGEVITMISGIADQINLLALNATIESARAGEAGKGFAVVASEVKNLATQTSKATETISAQITSVQEVVQAVVQSLGQIRGTISEVSGISSTIAAAVEEQGAATREIAMNIQRTSDRVRDVSSNVSEVGDMAVATNDNSKVVMQSLSSFNQQSKTLQKEIEQFLSSIAKA